MMAYLSWPNVATAHPIHIIGRKISLLSMYFVATLIILPQSACHRQRRARIPLLDDGHGLKRARNDLSQFVNIEQFCNIIIRTVQERFHGGIAHIASEGPANDVQPETLLCCGRHANMLRDQGFAHRRCPA
jgi:hypothetical protein